MLFAIITLTTFSAISALTANQPLLSRGAKDLDSWDDVPQSQSQVPLTTETDPYEVSLLQQDQEPPVQKGDDVPYVRPFNLSNGACKRNDGGRFVMEIESVQGGSYYVGKMAFGNPPQQLNMLLDTGSDEIVVKGKGCLGCAGRGYDSKASDTWETYFDKDDPNLGKEEIAYGSGAVIGQRGYDSVHTGHLSGKHMELLIVEKTSIGEFQDTSPHALEVIAGMAPGLPEYTGEKLASRMEVRHFSECLPQNSEENGFFVVNDDHPETQGYNGPFSSMGNYYWALGVTDFRFEYKDGSTPTKLGVRSFSALTDTGTTLLSVPQSVLTDLEAALRDLDYDCAQMDKLPDLTFDIDGHTHKLPPSTYIAESEGFSWGGSLHKKAMALHEKGRTEAEQAEYSQKKAEYAAKRQNYYFRNTEFVNKKTGAYCELLFSDPITMNSTLGEIGILGMPFFRNYIVSFDFCSRSIWTKPSTGDCSHAVGQAPSNKQWCKDGDKFGCFVQHVWQFIKVNIIDGFASIFTENKDSKSGPRLKIEPGAERVSQMAKWLLNGDKDAVVEI